MAKKTTKNAAAVALGRLGGQKKVPKGLASLDQDRRRDIARAGAAKRWGKKAVKKKT